jgi:hypothetical protein
LSSVSAGRRRVMYQCMMIKKYKIKVHKVIVYCRDIYNFFEQRQKTRKVLCV